MRKASFPKMPKTDVPKIWMSLIALALFCGITQLAREGLLNEALMDAAQNGKTSEVVDLLKQGADPSYTFEDAMSPLSIAASRGDSATVAVL